MTASQATSTRPAVFFVAGFGDQIMSLPAMRALSGIFPGGFQLFLGEGMLSFFYQDLTISSITRAWYADVRKRRIDVDRILPRALPCDTFVALSPWTSPSVLDLASRLGARRTVGHLGAVDERVTHAEDAHMFDLLFAVAATLRPQLQFEAFAYPPRFSAAAEAAALRFVRAHVQPGQRILFVHPETHTDKMWSAAAMSWVLQRFLDDHPDYVVFVASVGWYPLALTRHWDRIVLLDEHLELLMAAMRYADLFLGVDSCFLHAADLFRVPGVGLFGPTAPQRWGFRLSPHGRSVWGRGSMHAIAREDVLEALRACARAARADGVPQAAPADAAANAAWS